VRHGIGQQRRPQHPDEGPRERNRAGERDRRQQDPVEEQLPEHASRASTQRETNRDLVAAGQRSRQREAREVGTRDGEEQPHECQDHRERVGVPAAETRKT
jgi:hypothetical protein